MQGYHVVASPTNRRRTFTISFGLVEGYDSDSVTHHAETAYRVALDWMAGRAAENRPVLSGFFTENTLLYAWRNGSGQVVRRREPSLRFMGEVSITYLADISDSAVKDMLNELAARLGAALNQVRVYVSLGDETWILEADGQTSPRADTRNE